MSEDYEEFLTFQVRISLEQQIYRGVIIELVTINLTSSFQGILRALSTSETVVIKDRVILKSLTSLDVPTLLDSDTKAIKDKMIIEERKACILN